MLSAVAGYSEADSETDTQPRSVPGVGEQSGRSAPRRRRHISTAGASEPLVSTTVTIQAEDEESVYAKPIREDSECVLSITAGRESTERTVAGGGLRSIEVDGYSTGRVDVSRVDT